MAENKEFSFEEKITELEAIVQAMEKGDAPLDAQLENFEQGIKIARECTGVLDSAEKKISILTKKPSGEMTEEAME
ncbi:MAG: exodeoxyribonuclease VII small subunit [Oscillospiraceae bacterium]|nr:exodeoxyribonuclease VII small subunit [Oscillospiraceae bacterium]